MVRKLSGIVAFALLAFNIGVYARPAGSGSDAGGTDVSSSQTNPFETLFTQKRNEYINNPAARTEVADYERGVQKEFPHLNGLLSPNLIETLNKKLKEDYYYLGDTFFTRYEERNPPENVLHTSKDGKYLVIANIAAFHTGLYPGQEERAGMSYVHLLVIPKDKVYNAVSLEDPKIVEEMDNALGEFLSTADAVDKMLKATKRSLDVRIAQVRGTVPQEDIDAVNADYEAFHANLMKIGSVGIADFMRGFHPADLHSVGHIHEHVVLLGKFRARSTGKNDYKTIPPDVVKKVINELPLTPLTVDA